MESEMMKMAKVLAATSSAFGIITMLHGAATGGAISEPSRDLSVVDRLSNDYPIGVGAIVTPVFIEHRKDLSDRTLSTFLVDYPPGASAVLHGMPSSGYVMVHVLSGTIHALAWHAGVGIYHTGETWVFPAFAHCIATANSSDEDAARALVVLVTGRKSAPMQTPNDTNCRELGKSST
jgi:quercetin dioxygenase-like cupin family protein